MKNTVYVIVIAVCLILAGVIFVLTRSEGSGGLDSIQRGELVWVMCNNPNCKEAYQIDKKDYYEQVDEQMRANPMAMVTPALTCKKCGEQSVYMAVKCEKCGKMFFSGAVANDFADRCPDPACGYSKTEAERKARLAEQGR